MKPVPWISEYGLLSEVDGKIESIIMIIPGALKNIDESDYTPFFESLNRSDRQLIRFFNDFSDINSFFQKTEQERKDKFSTNWRSQPKGSSKDALDIWRKSDEEIRPEVKDWRKSTKYYSDTQPTISPPEWVKHLYDEISQKGRNHKLLYPKWVQDPMVAMQKGKDPVLESTLIYSLFQTRVMDYLLPLELAEEPTLNLRCHPTKLYLEGGNMLYIDKILFVGKDLILENVKILNEKDAKAPDPVELVIEKFETQFNVEKVIALGTEELMLSYDNRIHAEKAEFKDSYQPFFHIDLFLNFGPQDPASGKRIAYLGSPQLAMDLLDEARIRYPSTFHDYTGSRDKLEALITEREEYFIQIRKQLKREGFEITEIPIYIVESEINRAYEFYSWNNCLTEIYDQGLKRHIYLPSYLDKDQDIGDHNPSLELLENFVQKVFKDDGFQVHFIDAGLKFRQFAQQGGSLHCLTKVLRRKYS